MKRTFVSMICLVLAVFLLAGCAAGEQASPSVSPSDTAGQSASPSASPSESPAEKTTVKVAALSGPTGMGMVKLMKDNDDKTTTNDYEFTLAGAPEEIVGKVTSGEIDIAAVPTNLAATLYQKTNGGVQMAALNTLGVLYIVDKGEEINSVADLKGKTIYASGQGSTPEYILNYILEANGIADDVKVVYKSEHAEVASLLASGEATVALLPEPFVTATKAKVEGLETALDITKEWENASKLEDAEGSVVSMGCIVVRSEFAQQNKEALDAFLEEYKASIEYVNANGQDAAELVVSYGIMENAKPAAAALPKCNIVYVDGQEMKESISNFFEVLYQANPASIGGKLPDDAFYYTK